MSEIKQGLVKAEFLLQEKGTEMTEEKCQYHL